MALVVADYDEAIAFYTEKIGFVLVEDTVLSETKRWVLIRPKGSDGACLLLAKAANEEQKSRVGKTHPAVLRLPTFLGGTICPGRRRKLHIFL